MEDLGQAFDEIARVLRPDGKVVIGVGDPSALSEMPFTAHGFTLRPIDDLKHPLRDTVQRTQS